MLALILMVLGWAVLSFGVGLGYLPAGVAVAGVGLVLLGVDLARKGPPARAEEPSA